MAKGVVRTAMERGKTPSVKGTAGVYDRNPSVPFGKPHDTGNGGIPLKFTEDSPRRLAQQTTADRKPRR